VSEEKEAFLDRWSRLKQQEQAKPPAEERKQEPAPVVPAIEDLRPDSDFRPFMDPRIDGETRRAALKKLFDDAHFKTIDPFEPYSIDLTGEDPIPPEMLKTLQHARRLLSTEPEPVQEPVEQAKEAAAEQPLPEANDGAGKQDA
jgi:hypothetical protein